jgi:heme A synthase
MSLAAARDGADDLRRFRRLVAATIVATFALILIGGIVRVSESGLGCGAAGSGTEGWPLCGGRVLPFLNENALIEFSHRVAATIVVILIGAMVVLSIRRLPAHRWLVRGSVLAAALVIAQAALGGLTVEHGLAEALVAAHLGLAMLLLGLLLGLHRASEPAERAEPVSTSRGLRTATATAAVLVLTTIVAGGLVAGTEREGAEAGVQGAHLACGKEFPTCNGSVLPFGADRLVDIQLAHRVAMVLAVAAILTMFAIAARAGVTGTPFRLAPTLLALQVILGAGNVWLGEHPGLIVAHLMVGTLLWATVVAALASLYRVPAPAPEPVRREAEPEAVTA